MTEPTESVSASLDRALRIIFATATAEQEDVGISELARETGLSKAVVHRIARTLVAREFFAYDDRTQRYRLGPAALIVGMSALSKLDVARLAQPYLQRLVDVTNETATLSALVGSSRLYVSQVLSPQEIRMSVTIGTPFSLLRGGSSLSILAALPDDRIREILSAELGAETSEFRALNDRVEGIRREGYAVSHGERQSDAASVSCAIRGADGSVFGAASVCGPVDRFVPEKVEAYQHEVRQMAISLSRDLGYRGTAIY